MRVRRILVNTFVFATILLRSLSAAAAPPAPSVQPAIPADVDIPADFEGNPIAFFDDYSWKSFIALNWRAKKPGVAGARRGDVDANTAFGDVSGATVWETWKADWEMFPSTTCLQVPGGCTIAPWDVYGPNPCGVASGPDVRVLASFSSFENLAQAGFGSLEGPIVDQGHHYVRFEIRVNEPQFAPIEQRKLFLRANLPTSGTPLTFADGKGGTPHAIGVKAAWRDVTDLSADKKARFFQRSSWVLDPVSGTCSERTMGLVGFHIVQKTVSRPQWIWSSFEHVDNVPETTALPGSTKPQAPLSFNDGTGSPASPKTKPLTAANPPVPNPPKTQIKRGRPIHNSTEETNVRYHSDARVNATVFSFYKLVMTQWPVRIHNDDGTQARGIPDHTFPGTDSDSTAFANAVIETFRQSNIDHGCMNCHDAATTDAFSDFVWFPSTRAIPPPGFPEPPPAPAGGVLSMKPVQPTALDGRLEGLKNLMETGKR